jgi:hypothetical protein
VHFFLLIAVSFLGLYRVLTKTSLHEKELDVRIRMQIRILPSSRKNSKENKGYNPAVLSSVADPGSGI